MNITDFSMEFFSLKEKTAIITGGNTGLGQAFSLALAKAGANVFIPSLVDDGGHTETLIAKEGVDCSFMQVDITQDGAPTRIVQKCLETYDSVDILVNSAGICINRPVAEFGRQDWDRMLSVNLTAAFEMSYEVTKPMIANNHGKIINICSLFSYLGGQWSPAYAATKHGLAGFTKAYSDELAGYNIQVNGIAPGYYATDLTLKTRSDPVTNQRVLDHIPANRWGETVDLMGATIFLASRASDYVNGHILVVDGGYLVR